MPKTVDTSKVGYVESMQQSSATTKNKDVGRALRKIVACSQPYLAVLSLFLAFGTVSSLHLTSDFYTCFTLVSLGMSTPSLHRESTNSLIYNNTACVEKEKVFNVHSRIHVHVYIVLCTFSYFLSCVLLYVLVLLSLCVFFVSLLCFSF